MKLIFVPVLTNKPTTVEATLVVDSLDDQLKSNAGMSLKRFSDDLEIDAANYQSTVRASYSLDPDSLSAAANDAAENWCTADSATSAFDTNDGDAGLGSPGVANQQCP